MALFTLDDLEFMENEGRNLFGSSDKQEEAPSRGNISTILNYSQALSIRQSTQLDEVRMILN